jgi:hypothetical protein
MDVSILITSLRDFLAALAVLFLPGTAVLLWTRPKGRDPIENIALASGLSLAINGIFGVLMNAMSWKLGSRQWLLVEFFLLFCSFVAILFHLIRSTLIVRKRSKSIPDPRSGTQTTLITFAGLAFFALIIAFRLLQSNDLILPSWVESVNQVFLANKMVNATGVPQYLMPELPGVFAPFLVFPFSVSIFVHLIGWEAAGAVLFMGQLVNALISLSIYRLGMALLGDWKRAGLAALLAGFAFTLPGYFLTWGRYALLSGLVMLPLAMAEIIQERPPKEKNPIFFLAMLTAGILLADSFTPIAYFLFILCWYGHEIFQSRKSRKKNQINWLPASGIGLGFLMALNWLVRMKEANAANPLTEVLDSSLGITSIFIFPRDILLYMLGAGGLLWLILEKRKTVWILWSSLMFFFSAVRGLPDGWIAEDFAVSLFLPATILSAHLLISSGESLMRYLQPLVIRVVLGVGVLSLFLWGVRDTHAILDPVTSLAAEVDLEAFEWIKINTPQTARFFINTEKWLPGMYRGVDGGYWIQTLTGRGQLVPSLEYIRTANIYYERVNHWSEVASHITTCSSGFRKLLDSSGVQYLYLTEGRGSLQAGELENCPGLLKIYQKKGISLFEVIPEMNVDDQPGIIIQDDLMSPSLEEDFEDENGNQP